jgi:hypothetical protein
MRIENGTSEKDDRVKFISISLYDTLSSCTILRVTSETNVDFLLTTILNKVEILPNDYKYYNLVLVISGISELPDRCNHHWVRTLLPNEIVLNVESELTMKQTLKYSLIHCSIQWYFKDVRSDPLEIGEVGDLIQGESSDEEEEEEISLNDLSYIMQAEQTGYLLMRSSKDPNLWLRRFCILTDKLWCLNDRSKVPKASHILLNGSTTLKSKDSTLDCNGAIVLKSNHGMRSFIASSASDQQIWINELSVKASIVTNNDGISMAEVIISDEEAIRCQRLQSGMSCFLNKSAYQYSTTCFCCSERKEADSRDHTCSNRKNSHSVQHLKVCSNSTPPRACRKSNSIQIYDSYISSYINEIQYKDIQLYNALFFNHSVNAYKELFRLDLGISPEEQWKAVLEIFIDLLVPQFKRVGFLLAKSSAEETVSSEGSDIILFSCNIENKAITGLNDSDGNPSSSDSRNDISCGNSDRGGNSCSRIQYDKAEVLSVKSSRLDSLNSTIRIASTFPVDVWKIIPSEVMTRLYHKALSQISKCDPIKEDKKNQKHNEEDTGYSRTPSAGGEESSSFAAFFGVESLSNPSVTFASSSSHSLWNWTSRALRLTETGNDDDNDSHSYRNSYWDGDVGEVGARYEDGTVPNINLKDDHTESHSNNNCGAYIFLPILNGCNGAEDTYYLKDRRIRPDLALFDELCDELKLAINTS